jgi:hypothetical protein
MRLSPRRDMCESIPAGGSAGVLGAFLRRRLLLRSAGPRTKTVKPPPATFLRLLSLPHIATKQGACLGSRGSGAPGQSLEDRDLRAPSPAPCGGEAARALRWFVRAATHRIALHQFCGWKRMGKKALTALSPYAIEAFNGVRFPTRGSTGARKRDRLKGQGPKG